MREQESDCKNARGRLAKNPSDAGDGFNHTRLLHLLSSNVLLNGKAFAILASGNINMTGVSSIDLFNTSGNGGALTLVAGFNFTPTTGGQIGPDGMFYTLTTPSAGGSINLGTVNINTSTNISGAIAGNVIAVAQGGSISLGTITSTATTGSGGSVTLIGETAVTTGAVNITSNIAANSGSTNITTGTPTTTGTTNIVNGVLLNGGFIAQGPFNGNIALSSINAGNITITTGNGNITTGALTSTRAAVNINANGNISAFSVSNAHTIDVQTTGGTFSLPGASNITLAPDATGDAGTLVLNAALGISSYLNSNTAPLTILANGTTGTAGSVSISSATPFTIGNGADSIAITSQNSAAGGKVVVVSNNGIAVDPTAINVTPSGANGNGGQIFLTGNTITDISASSPLILDASGKGIGNGGTISITTNSATSAQTIGAGAGNIELTANSGASGGNGGTVDFTAVQNLVVNPAQISAAALGANGNGGVVNLSAGGSTAGTLSVLGSLSENGRGTGIGGTLDLASNSSSTFFIGSSSANGVSGSLTTSAANSANDGTISITNLGGSLLNAVAIDSANNLSLTAGDAGSILIANSLTAPGASGTINLSSGVTGSITYSGAGSSVTAGSTINFSAQSGTIGTSTTALAVTAPTVFVNSAGGAVNIRNFQLGGQNLNTNMSNIGGGFTYAGTGNITVNGVSHNALTANGNIALSSSALVSGDAPGNFILGGNVVSTAPSGAISLSTGGTGSLSGSGWIQAQTVILQSSSGSIGEIGKPLNVSASDLSTLTTGLVDINNNGTTGVTLVNANTTSGFILTPQSQININTGGLSNAAAILLQAQANNGGVAINNVNVGGTATTGGLTVFAQGTGQITETGSGTLIGGPMNLTAGSGGIYLNLNTTNITANGGGIVSLGNLSFSTATLNNSSAGASFSLGSNGSLTLNNLTASNGYVNILSAGSLLQTVPGAAISANNGIVLLENANTSSGSIVIGAGDYIHTNGTGNQFPVYIVIGTAPTNPIQGSKPASVTVNNISGGTAFFGTNGISAPTDPVTLNLKGSNIVFNTGSLSASAITVNGNVTITADPITADPLNVDSSTVNSIVNATAATISLPSSIPFSLASIDAKPAIIPVAATSIGLAVTKILEETMPASQSSMPLRPTNLLEQPSNIGDSPSTATAGQTSSRLGSSIPIGTSTRAIDYWMSDTELSTGRIPAILFSDEELGVKSDVSTVVELDEEKQYPVSALQPAKTNAFQKTPLVGVVSRSAAAGKTMRLNRGSVVFAPSTDTVVRTAYGDIRIAAKSIVFVMSFQHGLAVYNLHDDRGRAVSVKSGDQELVLSPGMQVVISRDSVHAFEEINPASMFGYRNLRTRSIGEGMQAFISDFSVPQAITSVTTLRQVVTSKHPQARKCATKMLKTAAILSQLSSGTYEHMARPGFTAFLSQTPDLANMVGQ